MNTSLSKLRTQRANRLAGEKNDKGFTLIELLVVVVILGVLIAVAIPLYLNYRKGANDSAAQSDLRNAMSVFEICNTDKSKYPTATFELTSPTTTTPGDCTTQKVNLSNGSKLNYTAVGAGVSYIAVATNTSGSGKVYCYNSSKGGTVTAITPAAGADYKTVTC